ncbi:MAG: prepilin-type N-terminal cleavage/methylation domain-containing protein [Planctomycetia bacterium]|nr:prepilin-type N-terminal cleavage/methylation domain-containing protein [Planctomycetia bacterium]
MRDYSATRRYGFTLIEMMTVIIIIALLAGISIVAYRSTLMTFRGVTAKNQMDGIVSALEQYKIKYGEYPPDNTDSDAVKRHVLKRWPELTPAEVSTVTSIIDNDPQNHYSDPARALFFWLCGPKGLGFPLDVKNDLLVGNGFNVDESTHDNGDPVIPREAPFITPAYDDEFRDNANSGNATSDDPSRGEVEDGYYFVFKDKPIFYFRAEKNTGYDNKSYDTGTWGDPWTESWGTVAPYMKNGKWINPTSYQLIHMGEDGLFSTSATPRDIATCTPADLDNIVNFSEGSTLGSEQ